MEFIFGKVVRDETRWVNGDGLPREKRTFQPSLDHEFGGT